KTLSSGRFRPVLYARFRWRAPPRSDSRDTWRARVGADRRSIEELLVVAEASGAELALALQADDRVDERCMRPRFRDALRLLQRDYVRRSFLDNVVAVEFEKTENRRFSRTWRTRQNVSLHTV